MSHNKYAQSTETARIKLLLQFIQSSVADIEAHGVKLQDIEILMPVQWQKLVREHLLELTGIEDKQLETSILYGAKVFNHYVHNEIVIYEPKIVGLGTKTTHKYIFL